MKNKRFIQYIILLIIFVYSGHLNAQIQLITGFEKGSYYEMGNDIRTIAGDIVSYDYSDTNWLEDGSYSFPVMKVPLIKLLSSKGSQHNFERMVKSTEAMIAFMQLDVLVDEQYKDLKKYSKKTDSIVLILPLGIEEIHLITLKESKIKNLAGLKGKKVAVGAQGMGTAVTAGFIKEQTGIAWADFNLSIKDALPALLNKQIDAFFFVGSAPVASLNGLSPTFERLQFIPISHSKLDPYYVKTTIPQGTYHWQKADVQTYGVRMILVSDLTKETPQDKVMIERFVNDVKNNISKLQENGHPNWKKVDFNFSDIQWQPHPVSKKVFGLP
jgi:uncharacterized protein